MKLHESYNELYAISTAYNELVEEDLRKQEMFSDLERFLTSKSDVIKKFALQPEIVRLFQKGDFDQTSIELIIQAKLDEQKKQRLIIKWVLILLVMIVCTVLTFGVILIVIGVVFYYKPKLRKKTWEYFKTDFSAMTKKTK